MLLWEGKKPIVLLLGEVILAQAEWNALGALAELRQVNEGTRDQFLGDCEAGVYDGMTGRFDQEVVDLLPSSLKFVSHNGAGYDSIDASACATRGISVSNTPGAVDASTADTTLFLIIGALRRIHIPATALRAGKWRGRMCLTHEPEGKTLGILGMGGIGTAVARRAIPFGMRVQYYNRSCVPASQNMMGAKYVSFEKLLETSDVISVHLPLNASTRGFISRDEFAMMKDGVVLINTARGPIVNEDALVEALESGKVWGAGLDVHEHEPKIHPGLIAEDGGAGLREYQKRVGEWTSEDACDGDEEDGDDEWSEALEEGGTAQWGLHEGRTMWFEMEAGANGHRLGYEEH
ncbi:MAG: hypothetical protein ASARMPRED_001292 [Alectoria sarmentosa]|nr:MAG: hypothetical protein ASARMPRED_001292 [Alectoria sarmentosa]